LNIGVCYAAVSDRLFAMKARRKWVIALGFAAVVASVAFVWLNWLLFCDGQPKYNDEKFMHWLLAQQFARDEAESDEAEQALSSIGTNAIPVLLKWLTAKEPRASAQSGPADYRWKIIAPRQYEIPRGLAMRWAEIGELREDPLGMAFWGFTAIGAKAQPAIPVLASIVAAKYELQNGSESAEWQSHRRYIAAEALGYLGQPACSTLMDLLQGDEETRRYAISGVRRLGYGYQSPETAFAIPILVRELRSAGSPAAIDAAWALGGIRWQPEATVPVLIEGLTNSDPKIARACVFALDKYGVAASNAIPGITQLKQKRILEDYQFNEVMISLSAGTNHSVSWRKVYR
jgi:hypothetical protein